MVKYAVAGFLALLAGAASADAVKGPLTCRVLDEARLSTDGSLAKDTTGWFAGYEFSVDVSTGAVSFARETPVPWKVLQAGNDTVDYILAKPDAMAETIRVRTWSNRLPRAPVPIVFIRISAARVFTGTCVSIQ